MSSTATSPPKLKKSDSQRSSGKVILVILDSFPNPNIDSVHTYFSKNVGIVEKLVLFNKEKNGKRSQQGLVQFHTSEMGARAMVKTGDKMPVSYSNLDDLQVKYNNERTWDYTNPELPNNEPELAQVRQSEGGTRQIRFEFDGDDVPPMIHRMPSRSYSQAALSNGQKFQRDEFDQPIWTAS